MHAAFFNAVRASVFGGTLKQDHVDGFNEIAAAWDKYGDGDDRKFAYILATAYHETARTMQPVREAFWLSEGWRKVNLRYYPYYGRGYVQLTWKANYSDWASRTGIDLVGHPDKVMEPKLAARILVQGSMLGTFTGKKLGDYITSSGTDFRNARRVINGTDKAGEIAKLADKFLAGLKAIPAAPDVPAPEPKPAPVDDPVPVEEPEAPRTDRKIIGGLIGVIAAAVAALAAYFGG